MSIDQWLMTDIFNGHTLKLKSLSKDKQTENGHWISGKGSVINHILKQQFNLSPWQMK